MNWIGYRLSMDMDIGKNMARHSTAKDGFYSSPRSWILGQEASFVNSGIGTIIVSRIHILRIPWVPLTIPTRSFNSLIWTNISLQRSPNFGHVFRSYISPRTTHLELSNPCSASFLASQYLRHLFPYTGHLFRYLTNAVK